MRTIVLILLGAVLVTGLMAAGTSSLSEPETKAARKIYTSKCARCHKFYDPDKYSDAEWGDWMEKMSRKAKLKPDQKELLARYLETFRDGSKTNLSLAP